jgi:hypothetical protein
LTHVMDPFNSLNLPSPLFLKGFDLESPNPHIVWILNRFWKIYQLHFTIFTLVLMS